MMGSPSRARGEREGGPLHFTRFVCDSAFLLSSLRSGAEEGAVMKYGSFAFGFQAKCERPSVFAIWADDTSAAAMCQFLKR